MTQTVLPRPIAWVLTRNSAPETLNLAPFSYFNAVCSDPPLVMLSVGLKPDGKHKDTRVNIEHSGEFVVNSVDARHMEAMNLSSASEEYGVSELDKLGLHTAEFAGFGVPRLRDAPVAFACTLYQTLEIGKSRQLIIFGEISHVHVDERVARADAKGRMKVDAEAVNPVGRLGAGEYALFGEKVGLKRPA